jgi:hypothetical protein
MVFPFFVIFPSATSRSGLLFVVQTLNVLIMLRFYSLLLFLSCPLYFIFAFLAAESSCKSLYYLRCLRTQLIVDSDNIKIDLGEMVWLIWTGLVWLRIGTSGELM